METPNWEAEAKRAVTYAGENLMKAHRGVLEWHKPTNTLLVFANDGEPSLYAGAVTKALQDRGIPIRATAISDDDYSFAMLVEYPDHEIVNEALWLAWAISKQVHPDFAATQKRVADDCIGRFHTGLQHPWEQ